MRSGNGWLLPPTYSTSRLWRLSSRIVCGLIGSYSKLWIGWMNRAVLHNEDQLHALIDRHSDRGLITITNHYSCMDDPLIWGVRKWRNMFGNTTRWIPTAEEICFTKPLMAKFFMLGRCVPVVRGDGVYQKCMDFCIERLNSGEWVHIFPEGKVNSVKEHVRLKWGVGRLVADTAVTPLVLPIYHIGMDEVLPTKKPYIPRTGKTVTILVGEPLDYTDIVQTLKKMNKSPREIRKHITDLIQTEFWRLRLEAEGLHADQVEQEQAV